MRDPVTGKIRRMTKEEREEARPARQLRRWKRRGAELQRAKIHAREAIAAFVENNAERLQGYLDRIEQENGARAAFDSLMSVVEFHIPKISRRELTGADGEKFTVTVVNGLADRAGIIDIESDDRRHIAP